MGSARLWAVLASAVSDTSISVATAGGPLSIPSLLPPCTWDLCWCFCPRTLPAPQAKACWAGSVCGSSLCFPALPSASWRLVGLPQRPELALCAAGFVHTSLSTWGFCVLLWVLQACHLVGAMVCELLMG